MKKLILGAILLLSVAVVSAKEKKENSEEKITNTEVTRISGTVTDDVTGELLVGVAVELEGSDVKVYSDLDGKFVFENVKPGVYSITASYISYEKSYVEKLTVEKNNQVDIKLIESN